MTLLKQVLLRPKLSLLLASLAFLAAIGGIRGVLSSSSSKPIQKPIVSPAPVSVQAAKETCGDPPDSNANDWYPMFIDGENLAEIQAKFCKDAIAKTREKTGKATVQLASFSDRSRAENFAQSGSGEVGESAWESQAVFNSPRFFSLSPAMGNSFQVEVCGCHLNNRAG